MVVGTDGEAALVDRWLHAQPRGVQRVDGRSVEVRDADGARLVGVGVGVGVRVGVRG